MIDTLATVAVLALLPAVTPFSLGEVLARWAALFDARGPPSIH